MAATPTKLMTFAEFEAIPDPRFGHYELHHGELVLVSPPKLPHFEAQRRIRIKLERAAEGAGVVDKEFPYRPLPEHECWIADVAYVSQHRYDAISDYLSGAPDLVVEVLSPSNSAAEMLENKQLCLENGAREFWVVHTSLRFVEVTQAGGSIATYKNGQHIPLFFGGSIAVADIFAKE